MTRMFRIFIFFILLYANNSFAFQQSDPATVLLTLNNASLEAYGNAKKIIMDSPSPVIVTLKDHMTLYYNKHEEQVKMVPEEYTELKTYAQIVLGIFSICNSPDSSTLDKLTAYREKVVAAGNMIESLNLTEEQRATQKQIVKLSLDFIDDSIKNEKINPQEFHAYFKKANPLIWKNVNGAAIAQINLLNQEMNVWHKKIPANDWKNLKVIVVGLHMPREHNLIAEFFSKFLKRPIDSEHLIYGENLTSEADARDLLARVSLDTTLGQVALNDSKRMYRDLLADSAQKYLERLFPN